jgi:hypothetical protein
MAQNQEVDLVMEPLQLLMVGGKKDLVACLHQKQGTGFCDRPTLAEKADVAHPNPANP